MIKTLLVDDDYLVRMYLKQITNWEKEGFTVVGDARDGEEALELVGQTHPALIITDLSMPVMDGIELIRTLKAQQNPAKLIVLSCHDEFAYVKEAMKLGADEYVLKNLLNEQELVKLLRTIRTKLEESAEQHQEKEQLLRMMKKGAQAMQRDVLRQLLSRSVTWEEQHQLTAEAGLTGLYKQCAVLLLSLSAQDRERHDPFFQLCAQTLRDKKAAVIPSDGLCCVLCDLTGFASDTEMRTILSQLVRELCMHAHEYLQLCPICGVSGISTGGGCIANAYRQAEEALLHTFYGASTCYYESSAPFSREIPAPAQALAQEIGTLISNGEQRRITDAWKAALAAFEKENVHPDVLHGWITRTDHAAGVTREDAMLENSLSWKEYSSFGLLYEKEAARAQALAAQTTENPAIRRAMDYIRQNYALPLSLNQVADEVHLNPAYLSYLFKQQTNVNFSDYVLTCRIEQVKTLLCTTDRKIREIAENTGFHDYRYFCRIFKKAVGLRPAEYRRSKKNPPV